MRYINKKLNRLNDFVHKYRSCLYVLKDLNAEFKNRIKDRARLELALPGDRKKLCARLLNTLRNLLIYNSKCVFQVYSIIINKKSLFATFGGYKVWINRLWFILRFNRKLIRYVDK